VNEATMASSPIITCPACAKKFKGRADLQGKKIKCPFCAEPFVVPKAGAEDKTAIKAAKGQGKEAAAPSMARQPLWGAEDEDQNPYGVTALDLAPRCPHCAKEMLSAEAVVCVYCGYNTLTRRVGETRKVVALTGSEHFMHLFPGLLCAGGILFLVLFMAVFCLVWPHWVAGGHLALTDHESVRMWLTVMSGFVIYVLGMFAIKRLILEPKPREKVKD
jgi:hypothetical protein